MKLYCMVFNIFDDPSFMKHFLKHRFYNNFEVYTHLWNYKGFK